MMAMSLHLSRSLLLVGVSIGLVVLSGAIFALAFLMLVLSGWDDWTPAWQIRLDLRLALWALFLSGVNIVILIALSLLILNPMEIFHWVEQAVLRVNVLLIILANVAIITVIAIIVCSIRLLPFFDAFSVWLWFLPLTSIVLSASAVFAIISAQQLQISLQYDTKPMIFLSAVTHIIIIVFSILLILSFPVLAETSGTMIIIWASISAAMFIIVCLNWRQTSFLLTATGAFTSAFTFSGAGFYGLFSRSGMHYSIDWPPIALTAIPLLLFLAILLRRCRLRSRNRP